MVSKISYVLFGLVITLCSILCILSLVYFSTGYWFDPILCCVYVFIMYLGMAYVYKGLQREE